MSLTIGVIATPASARRAVVFTGDRSHHTYGYDAFYPRSGQLIARGFRLRERLHDGCPVLWSVRVRGNPWHRAYVCDDFGNLVPVMPEWRA